MCVGGYERCNIWACVMAEVVIKPVFFVCVCTYLNVNVESCIFLFKIVLPAGFEAVSAVGFKCSYCNLFLIWSSLLRTRELFLCIFQLGGVGALNAFFFFFFSPRGLFWPLMCTKAMVPGVCHRGKHCVSVVIVPLSEPGCVGLPRNNLPTTEAPAANSCTVGELGVRRSGNHTSNCCRTQILFFFFF